jgi:hypothetical protein
MNKENSICTMEHYLVIKNEIMSFEGKWVQLEIIMLSKISQTQKDEHQRFLFICAIIFKSKMRETIKEK